MWEDFEALYGQRPGPDGLRYLRAADGQPQTRPFHLRWLIPRLAGLEKRRWWAIYFGSWGLLGVGMAAWATLAGLAVPQVVAAVVLTLALPGILGPAVSVPVQTDLPATALTVLGVVLLQLPGPAALPAAIAVFLLAACVRETAPVFGALWAWSPWPLVALAAPLAAAFIRKPAASSGVADWDWIAAYPVQAGLRYHAHHWRDPERMLFPWGVCLAGLFALDLRLAAILAVAYGQLLVATDTVRLYSHAAGPPLALAAAGVLPLEWIPPALALHVFFPLPQDRI